MFLQLENFGAVLFIANVSQCVQKVKMSGFGKMKLKTNSKVFALLPPVCLGDISGIYVLNQGKVFPPESAGALDRLFREWSHSQGFQSSRRAKTMLSGAGWDCWGVLGRARSRNG